MCYSAESSIENYISISLLSILLYIYGDKYSRHVALFFFVVGHMQLAEYFMWIDQDCGITNEVGTLFANFVLMCQGLVPLLGGYIFDTIKVSPRYIFIICSIFTVVWLMSMVNYKLQGRNICSLQKQGTTHLGWDFYDRPYSLRFFYAGVIAYFILLLLPWLFTSNLKYGLLIFAIILGSFLFHYIQYSNNWTSRWCYYTNIMLILYMVVRGIEKIKN